MKALKLLILSVIVTILTTVSWVIGTMIGNAATQSTPPPPEDVANAGLIFLAVCAFDAVLMVMMLFATEDYRGNSKRLGLIVFVFGIQHLLPQMETLFFASDMGISYSQAIAILIAGAISSPITVLVAEISYEKLVGTANARLKTPMFPEAKTLLIWTIALTLIAYPALYLTFGYFIAWQNENLRVYYTSSSDIASFPQQVTDSVTNGIYGFQILRGLIWIAVTTPVVLLMSNSRPKQYFIVAILCAVLPTSLLFIPNPYMPHDIAMTHFVETSTSNFVWALVMVAGIKRIFRT